MSSGYDFSTVVIQPGSGAGWQLVGGGAVGGGVERWGRQLGEGISSDSDGQQQWSEELSKGRSATTPASIQQRVQHDKRTA